jgi:hypothetical protein
MAQKFTALDMKEQMHMVPRDHILKTRCMGDYAGTKIFNRLYIFTINNSHQRICMKHHTPTYILFTFIRLSFHADNG